MRNTPPDLAISYYGDFIETQSAERLMCELETCLNWRQDSIRLYGRDVRIPRLQAFLAEPGISYHYSGLRLEGTGFPSLLKPLLGELKTLCRTDFNAVLVNLYRDGSDSMGWHSDDEPELGKDPVIASVTLGAERSFQFRHRETKERWELKLEHGSLLIMGAGVQKRWQHALPKRKGCNKPRINLTFRTIIANQTDKQTELL